ncbi:MAG: GNAT family N-acetyltransferase [Hamadaea sp.]|uniref:GNAT family N-acetyltransferase n=1 Tax=Hamadaea sp. TaxID=2024425 RepID=UPI00183596F4|nr:GNAT family N-acetyltransferase [Hamadaea sp.]NUR70261.1 GNAT family N-acetyltransferase [Hamadaea sp.]NUT18347.1 GNAT family N-acetyltransferase [Hamadaea sp.]
MDMNVQRSVVAQLSARPQVVQAGPFVLGLDPDTPSKYINYATPRPGETITAADVDALVAAFRSADRMPRLEYVANTAPDLERQLLAAGFTVEARHEYLVCTPDTFVDVPTPEGVEVAEPVSDADYWGMISAQGAAFGDAFEVGPADIERSRRTVARGGVVRLARSQADDVVVGGGQASSPSEGVAEVAGIAVTEPFRRRGIAGAITAAITREVFARGVEGAWLEASGDESWRVYERVGYVPTGKRLYIALES